MDAGRKPSVSLWAHPALYCIALPLVAVVLAVALAVRDQVVPTHGEPRVLAPWLSLAMGVCLGSLLALPQKRQLRRHRDFMASQCLPSRAHGVAVEMRWLRVLWPLLTGLGLAIGAAWWLAWPALVALWGFMTSLGLLRREARSIHVLAKRMMVTTDETPHAHGPA